LLDDDEVVDLGGPEAGATAIRNIGELLTPEGYLRSWPHRHGIGGAFVALLLHVN
jgi:16S rRNA C967 or C1407 C5-methylase (RsmB/RsmF family)